MGRSWMKAALCGLFVVLCGPTAFAQAQSSQAPSTQAEEPAPQAATESQAAEPPQMQATPYGDWLHRCVDLQTGEEKATSQCEVALVAQVKQGDETVTVLTLAIAKAAGDPAAEGEAAKPGLLLTALVPLNVFLPAGFGLVADGKPVTHIDYRNCNQSGCWAQQRLDTTMLNALKHGSAGEAQLRMMNGQTVNIRFSLNGITAALSALESA